MAGCALLSLLKGREDEEMRVSWGLLSRDIAHSFPGDLHQMIAFSHDLLRFSCPYVLYYLVALLITG